MKQIILLIAILVCGQTFAQQASKSDKIAKEIQLLELENNNLILKEYIKEQCDTTSRIKLEKISKKLVDDFQLSRPELKILKDQFDENKRQIDSIKYKDSEYRKYKKDIVGTTGKEKEEQRKIYKKIRYRLYKSDAKFKELMDENKKIYAKLSYLTLVQMTDDYNERGEILPTNFIPSADLYRYKQNYKVQENQKKINILNSLSKKVLEDEFKEKYNISDSTDVED